MRMDEPLGGEDPFTTKLLTFQQDGIDFSPVVASRNLLQSLSPGEVSSFIVCYIYAFHDFFFSLSVYEPL